MGRIAQLEAENEELRKGVEHWEANSKQQVKLKRDLHVKYDRLFRRSLRGRWLRLKKRLR